MKRSDKKLFALLMTLIMVVSLLPMGVFAADDASDVEPCKIHKYVETVSVITAATCETSGKSVTYLNCPDCGETAQRGPYLTDPLGHNMIDVAAKDATCTEDGYTAHKQCSRCDATEGKEIISATGHKWASRGGAAYKDYLVKAATCTEDPIYYRSCDKCGAASNEKFAWKNHALGHKYNDGIVTSNPTCEDTGVKTFTCTRENCGDFYTESISALGHTWGERQDEVLTEATCETNGQGRGFHVCATCGKDETIVGPYTIKAFGHAWGERQDEVLTEATCETNGQGRGFHVCATCGKDETIAGPYTIKAFGHTWGERQDEVLTEATCETNGQGRGFHVCATCGKDETIAGPYTIKATGHAWSERQYEDLIPATCTETGTARGFIVCDNCGEDKTVQGPFIVKALGHNLVDTDALAATCTEDGYTAHKQCSRCEYNEGKETIPALGHTEVVDAAVAATCTETGLTEGKHCSVCTEVLVAQTEVPALGHDWTEFEGQKPTCTEPGYAAYSKCGVCKVEKNNEVLPATGHTEVVDAAVAATCEAAGKTEGKHCSVCNEVLTAQESVAALGHKWDAGKVTKEPTATAKGEKVYTCANDATHTKTEEIAATGTSSNAGLDDVPKTGDASEFFMFGSMMIVALLGAVAVFFSAKKRTNR